jgi:hypothetical protein
MKRLIRHTDLYSYMDPKFGPKQKQKLKIQKSILKGLYMDGQNTNR